MLGAGARKAAHEPATKRRLNFLAHLLLAGDDREAQVGQVLADLIPAGSIASFAPGIQQGIHAHQRIDVFTDGHPAFHTARRRLRPPFRRFAGVLLDVYFDHFLAKDWDRHGNGAPLVEFADSRYEVLSSFRNLAVERYVKTVDAMRRENWLVAYSSLAGVERALKGIASRCRRENPIASGVSALMQHYNTLQLDFEAFFPELKAYAETLPGERSHFEGCNREQPSPRSGKSNTGRH